MWLLSFLMILATKWKTPRPYLIKRLAPLWCCWLVFMCLLNGWMDFPSGRKRHVVDGVHTSCDWSFLLSNEICKKTGGKKDKSTYKWKHNNVPIWLEQSLFTTWFYQFWISHPNFFFCNNLKKVGYFFLYDSEICSDRSNKTVINRF